jgi:hypothetical protein
VFAPTAASGRLRVGIGVFTSLNQTVTLLGTTSPPGALLYNYNTAGTCDLNPILSTINATVKVFLEGPYIGGGEMSPALYDIYVNNGLPLSDTPDPDVTDTIIVNLWDPTDLTSPVYSRKHVLRTNGECDFVLPGSYLGQSLWISITHSKSIEIWSSSAITITNNVVFDFTTNLTNTYSDGFSDPQKSSGDGFYYLIGGDGNQDGTIDIVDLLDVFSSQDNILFGLLQQDTNLDGTVDIVDLLQVFNQTSNQPFVARPY